MKKMQSVHRYLAVCVMGSLSAGAALAKVPESEAAKLGTTLTCNGAEKTGSAAGVPEYTGKWVDMPEGAQTPKHAGAHPKDPYADEKPLFVITAQNMGQYEQHLSEGQKAMFAKYPNSFRMPVYPGHRDFRYDDAVCGYAKKNAVSAEMDKDGLGVVGAVKGAVPFPIPKSGLELAFNNLFPLRAATEDILRDNASVLANGAIVWGRSHNRSFSQIYGPEQAGKPLEGLMAYNMNATQLPERDKGGVTLAVEPVHYGQGKRLTWSYDPGTRRVRQVPEFGFDQPMAGTGGKLTIDSDRLFNGSPERYDWQLVGKKEIYIPANAYKLHSKDVKYADLIKPGHANPDYMRYELRRVWVVDAKVKEGFRHVFGRRVLFLDEDSFQAVLSDNYDARGTLWQHAFVNTYYSPDINAWQAGTSFYHDLNAGSYLAYNLFQERPIGPVLNKMDMQKAQFTPEAVRSLGQ